MACALVFVSFQKVKLENLEEIKKILWSDSSVWRPLMPPLEAFDTLSLLVSSMYLSMVKPSLFIKLILKTCLKISTDATEKNIVNEERMHTKVLINLFIFWKYSPHMEFHINAHASNVYRHTYIFKYGPYITYLNNLNNPAENEVIQIYVAINISFFFWRKVDVCFKY